MGPGAFASRHVRRQSSASRRPSECEGGHHFVVHSGRSGQVLLSLHFVPNTVVELAKAEVTMGGQGTHPELVGPGEGLGVVPFCRLQVGRVGVRGNFAEEAQVNTYALFYTLCDRAGDERSTEGAEIGPRCARQEGRRGAQPIADEGAAAGTGSEDRQDAVAADSRRRSEPCGP
jgi:hypothetical protein